MNRKALIIACDNTASGPLKGPQKDYENLRTFLEKREGGLWYDREIDYLLNPTIKMVQDKINQMDADYTFVVFSGHGGTNLQDGQQYVELTDGDLYVGELITKANRQTILIDSCRTLFCDNPNVNEREFVRESLFSKAFSSYTDEQVRLIYEKLILQCEAGITLLNSASENEASVDSKQGAAYICSLLKNASMWESQTRILDVLRVDEVHRLACTSIKRDFMTNQHPQIRPEKRHWYYPFALSI